MGIGASIVLIAAGVILVWGTAADVAGVDLDVVGQALLIVGAIGALLSLVFWSSWGGARRSRDERGIVDR